MELFHWLPPPSPLPENGPWWMGRCGGGEECEQPSSSEPPLIWSKFHSNFIYSVDTRRWLKTIKKKTEQERTWVRWGWGVGVPWIAYANGALGIYLPEAERMVEVTAGTDIVLTKTTRFRSDIHFLSLDSFVLLQHFSHCCFTSHFINHRQWHFSSNISGLWECNVTMEWS